MRKEKKKSYAEVAKIYDENESLDCEIVKKEKNSCWFCYRARTAKIMPPVCDVCLVKMEKCIACEQ